MATQAEASKSIPPHVEGEPPDERGLLVRRRVSERFRRENRHYFRHKFSVSVARSCSLLARSIPTRTRYWIADRMGDLLYLLTPGYRRNVQSNL